MNKFSFHIQPKKLLIALTIILVLLIGVGLYNNSILNPVRSAINVVLLPMQKGFNSVGVTVRDRVELLGELSAAQEENETLKAQLSQANERINSLMEDTSDLKELRELYQLDNMYEDYTMIGARVISKESGNWFHSFLIDKGSDDGIKVDMNVVADGGLVGIVTEVGKGYSKVLSIIDDTSNVAAMAYESKDSCYVSGDLELYEDGVIRVMYAKKDAEINANDRMVTSNVSSKYLPGLLIGYVKEMQVDASTLTKSGTLIPYVDFEHLETVLIITTLKSDYQN